MASEVTGDLSTGLIGTKTLTTITSAVMQEEITNGLISIGGSAPTSTPNFTFNVDYVLKDGDATVFIPADTVVTKTGGGNLDLTTFFISDNTIEIKSESGDVLGSLKIGIPDINLTFSQPITITIPVGTAYNGQTLTTYYRNEGSTVWNTETTCLIANGNCIFQTSHSATFATRKNSTSSSSSSTTSTSSSNNSAPSCGDALPGAKAPWLYGAIAQDSGSVLLYFTPSDNPVNKYVLEYGTKSGDYPYGVQDMGVNSRSQMTFLVKSLLPNTTYYFKVRGGNGCATGSWSNEISAKTKGLVSFNQLEIAQSELETIPAKETETCQVYTVKSGDSLWSIASKLLNDGNKYQDIIEQNKDKYPLLETSNNLKVGWELKINCGITQKTNEAKTQNGYDVSVKVTDTNKKPIVDAKVTIHSKVQEGKTDKDGIVLFHNVEQGEHKVLIAYNNFEGEQSVNLTGDVKEFDLNVTVQKKAISLSPLAYVIIGVLILIILVLIVLLKKSKAKTAGLLIATLVAVSSFLIVPNTVLAAGSLTVTKINVVKTYAETDNTYPNGWSWVFDVTVPTNETALNMKFANWVSGSDSISVGSNTRFYSSQSSNASSSSSAITIGASGVYSDVMNLNPASDLDAVTGGIQIQITVEFKVPVGSADGSYSTTYGVQTIDPDIAKVAADKAALVDASIKGSNPDLANITVGLTNPLPSSGANGSAITWVSDTTSVVSSNGQTINRPLSTSENATVILTATLTKGAVTDTKAFTLTVIKNTGVQATPTFDPAAGAIAFGTTVTITSAGADAIYYTTNGVDPTTSSTRQSVTPLVINSAVTVKALAVKAGYDNSAIGTAAYTQAATANLTGLALSGSPANYTFAGTTYDYTGVTVLNAVSSITVTPTGAGTITVEGTTVVSGQASGAIALTAGTEKTITIIATETGKSNKTYTIKVTRNNSAQDTPTFDPAAGAIAFGTTVTITSSGADAIYYTTDGTDPTTASTRQSVTPLVINAAVTVKALAVKAGYDNSAIGTAAYTQAAATVPSNIVLAAGSTAPVGGVTNVAIPAAGAIDTTGAVTGWVTNTNDKIKFTVTDAGGSSTITIGGGAYTSGADYQIPSTSSLSIVVTTAETGKVTGTRTFTITVAAAPSQATPTFDPAAGAIAFGTTVTILSSGADAIYYTTNGSTPTISSTNQATTPLVINAAVTVKALAVKAGYDNSAIGSAAYTQAAATVPSNIVLAAGSTNPVGGVTNVVIPAAGATDTTGAVTGWKITAADKIAFTVTDNGGTSTITIGGGAYTSGANYQIPSTSSLSIVVTTTETGKVTGVRTFTVPVAAGVYVLRETGPAGGLIFYDKGSYSNGWRYLEAASPSTGEWTAKQWGCYGSAITGADGTAVGTGNQNTTDIITGCAEADRAAKLAYDLSFVNNSITYSDWFLPSKDELALMYTNLKAYSVGGFANTNYWSSSEYNTNSAWYQYFYDGLQSYTAKNYPSYVRAVRAF